MFDIKPESRMDLKEQLLYNIWQELKNLNRTLAAPIAVPFTQTEDLPKVTGVQTTAVTGLYCKHCNGYHEKPIEIINCGRKLKKG